MSKTKRKWIEGCNSDSEPNVAIRYVAPDALRAWDVPYDATWNVWQAINYGLSGVQGPKGATGLFGATGIQGNTGFQGFTGLALGSTGVSGPTGILGPTGIQGETGIQGGLGIQGGTGVTGETGIQGVGVTGLGYTGVQGFTGLSVTGPQGVTGLYGQTGLQGLTGINSGGFTTLFNPVSRYEAVSASNEEVWIVSSSSVYTAPWDRSGTNLTITRNSHGHSAGNFVVVRDTNVDYQAVPIDSTTANSFLITTANSGATSGQGAYSLGFTYSHTGTGGVVYAPTGDHADAQLLTLRIRTNGNSSGTTYDLEVPASAINGAGQNTSMGDCFIPDFNVRRDSDSLIPVGATIKTNVGGSYSTFEFGNLGVLPVMIIAHF